MAAVRRLVREHSADALPEDALVCVCIHLPPEDVRVALCVSWRWRKAAKLALCTAIASTVPLPILDAPMECPCCWEPMDRVRLPCAFAACTHAICYPCAHGLALERSADGVLVACPLCRTMTRGVHVSEPLLGGKRCALLRGAFKCASTLRGLRRMDLHVLESAEAVRLDREALEVLHERVVERGHSWAEWWKFVARQATLAQRAGERRGLQRESGLAGAVREVGFTALRMVDDASLRECVAADERTLDVVTRELLRRSEARLLWPYAPRS